MPKPPKAVIEYRRYELPLVFPIVFLDGDRWHISDIKSDNLHFHNCLEIGICHSQGGILMFNDEEVNFRAGDVTCIPRLIPHTTYSAAGEASLWSYIFVNLGELFMNMFNTTSEDFEIPILSGSGSQYVFPAEEYPKIQFMVSALIDELRHKKPNYEMVVRGLFLVLYYEFLRLFNKATDVPTKKPNILVIEPALTYIYQNYESSFSVDLLAELCHLSPTHFRRVFLSIMGNSPLEFINITRIEKACVLLQTTDKQILRIAEEVGFRSISSFNRSFDKVMGISPREYRNPIAWPDIMPNRQSILEYSGWL